MSIIPFGLDDRRLIDARDFDAAAETLWEIADRITYSRIPMEEAKLVAIDDMHDRFDKEIEPSGYKWFELTALYVAQRGAEHPILDDTGTKKSWKKREHPPGTLRKEAVKPENWTATNETLFYSTAGLPDYWAAHQYGNKTMKGMSVLPIFAPGKGGKPVRTEGRIAIPPSDGHGLPPRPFIGLSEDADDEIIAIFDRWFSRVLDEEIDEYEHETGGGTSFFDDSPRIGSVFRGRTITSVAKGAGGRPQFRTNGRFGPMA